LRTPPRRHGSNYVDLECILKKHPSGSLDLALHLSRKLVRLIIESAKQWIAIMLVVADTRKRFERTPTAGRLQWASGGV